MSMKKVIKNSNTIDIQRTVSETLPAFNSKRLDKINYNREKLKILSEFQKPFILTATLEAKNDVFVTFTNVKPYIEKIAPYRIGTLCDHVNIRLEDVLKYIDYMGLNEGLNVFLLCEVKVYYSKFNEKRYGVNLTEQLETSAIKLEKQKVKEIPKDSYLQFTKKVLSKLDIRILPPKKH